MAGEADAAVVGDDQARPVSDGIQDAAADQGMLFGGVGADDEDDVGLVEAGDGVGHRPGAECFGQSGHGGGVAEAGAVVDVVGAEHRPGKLHQQVILLVGRLGRGGEHDRIGPVPLLHVPQPFNYQIERLVPSGRLQHAVTAQQRSRETVGMVDEGEGVPPLDAETAAADRMGDARLNADQTPVVAYEVEGAANPAVRADREGSFQEKFLRLRLKGPPVDARFHRAGKPGRPGSSTGARSNSARIYRPRSASVAPGRARSGRKGAPSSSARQ